MLSPVNAWVLGITEEYNFARNWMVSWLFIIEARMHPKICAFKIAAGNLWDLRGNGQDHNSKSRLVYSAPEKIIIFSYFHFMPEWPSCLLCQQVQLYCRPVHYLAGTLCADSYKHWQGPLVFVGRNYKLITLICRFQARTPRLHFLVHWAVWKRSYR